MAQVPYSPIPTVTPSSNSGLPYQNAAGATPEAFGSNIGQAEQQLGNKVENVGDVLQKHAVFYQDRANQADADNAFINGSVELGKLETQFYSLQGQQAKDAYPKYIEDLNKARDNIKNGLPNPEVARMFDREFNRRLSFAIIDGGRHAATQEKAFQNQTTVAREKLAVQDAGQYPKDDEKFDVDMSTIREQVGKRSVLQGWDNATYQVELRKAEGDAWVLRLNELSKIDPIGAKKLFDENKDKIFGQQKDQADRVVRQGMQQYGARKDADEVYSPDKPLTDMLSEGRELAEKHAKDDPLYADTVESRIKSRYNTNVSANNARERQIMSTVQSALFNTEKPPTTLDELFHSGQAAGDDPTSGVQDLYNQLSDSKKKQVNDQLVKNSKADPNPLTQENFKRFEELKGMAANPNTREDFANVDLMSEKLPRALLGQLLTKQQNLKALGQEDLKMSSALSQVRPMLNAAGIVESRTDKDKASSYNLFYSQFQDAVQTFEQQHKKPPSPQESQLIAAGLIRNVETPGRFFGTNTERYFERTITPAKQTEIQTEFKRRYGRDPQPQEIQTIYNRMNP